MVKNRVKEIPKLLANTYAEIILSATYYSAKSVQELARAYDIPIAACYRKMHELEDAEMVKCVEVIKSPRGKAIKLYRANIKEAHLTFEKGEFRIKLQFKTEKEEREWVTVKLHPHS